jgi:hypothetical protein
MENPTSIPDGDPVRFFILAAGRTGSTRLRLLLDSHPLAKCHGELFGENLSTLAEPDSSFQGQLLGERSTNPARFLHRRALEAGYFQAVGFKILYHQLTREWPGLLEAALADHELRVIHLVRRNGLKRFLSEYFVGTVTKKNLFFENEALPSIQPVFIPVEPLLSNLEMLDRDSDKLRGLFRSHPFHEIAYEDSLDDNGPAMCSILDFLNLPPASLSVPIKKILPDDPARLIANFQEVEEALRGTRHEWMLADG